MRRTHTILGVDIGTTAVRLVAVQRKRSGLTVTAVRNLPIDLASRGKDHRIVASLRDSLAQGRLGDLPAIVGVPGNAVVMERVDLPAVSEDRIEQVMSFEVQRLSSISVSRIVYDYCILPGPQRGGPKTAFLALTQREAAERRRAFCQECGLRVMSANAEQMALVNATLSAEGVSQDPFLLLHIGATSTLAIILEGGRPVLSRTIPTAGEEFTRAMMSATRLGRQEAEEAKPRLVLRESGMEDGPEEALGKVAKELCFQVKSLLAREKAQSKSEWADLRKVALSGGGAGLPGLVQMVGRELDLPCEFSDPFRGVSVTQGLEIPTRPEDRAQFTVAMGLALECALPGALRTDLSPTTKRHIRAQRDRRVTLVLSSLAGIAFLGLSMQLGYQKMSDLQRRIEQQGERLKKIEMLARKIAGLNQTIDVLERRADIAVAKAQRGQSLFGAFSDLSRALPQDIWIRCLTSWEMEQAAVRSGVRGVPGGALPPPDIPGSDVLEGLMISGYCESPKAFLLMEDFVACLDATPSVVKATLVPLSEEDRQAIRSPSDLPFKIRLDLIAEPQDVQ